MCPIAKTADRQSDGKNAKEYSMIAESYRIQTFGGKVMDAVKFLKEKNRMCNKHKNCFECPVGTKNGGCQAGIVRDQEVTEEELVSIVEKWADEHPAKTRQSEFLKMFPNAKRNGDYIDICPKIVDVKLVDQCKEYDHYDSCDGCKKDFWREEVE